MAISKAKKEAFIMIADPNLVNAIEGLTNRLSGINLIMWMHLMIMIVVGFWFVVWTHKKDKE